MCTLALFSRVSTDLPLVVAANRDEFLSRPTAPPRLLCDDPWVLAGQDLEAGGTWLGLNQAGMVVGLLNRRTAAGPDPSRSSRGILCLRALQCRSLAEVEEMLMGERGDDYNPFTLLVASAERAFVGVPAGAEIERRPLPPGVHLLTNLEVNDPTCPRIAKSHQIFEGVSLEGGSAGSGQAALVEGLHGILSDHSTQLDPRGPQEDNSLCIHAGPYGTRSSAIISTDAAGSTRYWHCEGPPCQGRFQAVALPRS